MFWQPYFNMNSLILGLSKTRFKATFWKRVSIIWCTPIHYVLHRIHHMLDPIHHMLEELKCIYWQEINIQFSYFIGVIRTRVVHLTIYRVDSAPKYRVKLIVIVTYYYFKFDHPDPLLYRLIQVVINLIRT